MTNEERTALTEVLIYIISSLYTISGQIPDHIQDDLLVLQGVKKDDNK